jgi:hypothetical protein
MHRREAIAAPHAAAEEIVRKTLPTPFYLT